MANAEAVEAFIGITGANRTAAEHMLELCGSDLEQAVQLWYADEDLQRTLTNAGSSGTAAQQTPGRPNRPQIGREDEHGVIHIDSDDDVPMTQDDFAESDAADEAANIARKAQEEEDAAMAKRLQEELYSGQAADEDGVRAPIGRTTETLVAPTSYDDDGHAAVLEQLRRRRQAQGELALAWFLSDSLVACS